MPIAQTGLCPSISKSTHMRHFKEPEDSLLFGGQHPGQVAGKTCDWNFADVFCSRRLILHSLVSGHLDGAPLPTKPSKGKDPESTQEAEDSIESCSEVFKLPRRGTIQNPAVLVV